MTAYKYREQARGLHTLETVERDLTNAENPRTKAFLLLAYARLTDEARAYLERYVAP
jgi:hypothetical protein